MTYKTILKILCSLLILTVLSCDEEYIVPDEPFFTIQGDSDIYIHFMSPNDTGFRNHFDEYRYDYYNYGSEIVCPVDMTASQMNYKAYLSSNDSLLGELVIEYKLHTEPSRSSSNSDQLVFEEFIIDTSKTTLINLYDAIETTFSIRDSIYTTIYTDKLVESPSRHMSTRGHQFYLKM
ncbi:MAG: hypothetical protein ACPGYY_02700 [Bacteroidia bacterium]